MATDRAGYQGNQAAIQCGSGGLCVNLNPSKILLKNVILAENVVFRQDDWHKMPGTLLFGTNNTAAAAADRVIVAINDWHPTATVQRLVHLRGDGHLYFTANGGSVIDAFQSVTTSGAGTRKGFFVTGGSENGTENRKLFLFRSNKLPTFVDGDVTNDVVITLPATDWSDATPPITGIINGPRLWAAGNLNLPHQLYASVAGDHTDFQTVIGSPTDFQSLSIFPGVGERIMALANYQGYIIVFKYPRGIFLQDSRDTDPLNWLTQQITDTIGIAPSPYAALQLENDVLFLGSDGQFYLLSVVIAAAKGQQNMQTANLGMDLEIYQFLLESFNRGRLDQIQSVYYPFWQTALFTVPGPGQTVNQTWMLFDFTAVGRQRGEPRFSYSYRDHAASVALRRNPSNFIDEPLFGDYDSHIILLEQPTTTTWDAVPYPMRIQTPHTNLGEFEVIGEDKFVSFASRNKLFDNLEVEYLPLTPCHVTVRVYVDGDLKQTIPYNLEFGGAMLDFFILDTDRLGTGFVRSIVHRLNCGIGRRISLSFENIEYGEDVAITHLFLGVRPSDTTQSPRL